MRPRQADGDRGGVGGPDRDGVDATARGSPPAPSSARGRISDHMIESIKNILVHAGATWVLWLLFGLSILSLAVMLERARIFWAQRDDVSALVRDLHRLLEKRQID